MMEQFLHVLDLDRFVHYHHQEYWLARRKRKNEENIIIWKPISMEWQRSKGGERKTWKNWSSRWIRGQERTAKMGIQTRFLPALNHGLVDWMTKDEHLKNSSEKIRKRKKNISFISIIGVVFFFYVYLCSKGLVLYLLYSLLVLMDSLVYHVDLLIDIEIYPSYSKHTQTKTTWHGILSTSKSLY